MASTIPVDQDFDTNASGYFATVAAEDLEKTVSDWSLGRLWHLQTPASLKKDTKGLEPEKLWKKWQAHLSKRKSPGDWDRELPGKADPVCWGLVESQTANDFMSWLKSFDRNVDSANDRGKVHLEAAVAQLVLEMQEGPIAFSTILQCLAVACRLPKLSQVLGMRDWWQLAVALKALCESGDDARFGDDLTGKQLLESVIVSGEIPYVLSVLLPEIKPFRELRSSAQRTLGESLLAATDGEGLVAARMLAHLPMVFASWTRSRCLSEAIGSLCWSSDAETQYEWLVRQTVLLTRGSGQFVLSKQAIINWPAGVLDVALDLAGDESDVAAANAHLPKLLETTNGKFRFSHLPDVSVDSEWSGLAIMASGWERSDNRVIVDYSGDCMRLEIESQSGLLFCGEWPIETSFGGNELKPTGEWEQQCWFSDHECDYLDLSIDLTGGAKLERQILLGKEDEFVLLHDVLHSESSDAQEWKHAMRLPLATGIEFQAEAETRDGILVNAKGKPRATVLPLSLTEWRSDFRFGELESTGSQLSISTLTLGHRLSCPMWIDLKPKRTSKPRTWRQLTVAESLEVTPPDVAVGYRVQVGSGQWLVYRSLAEPANRTLLGQNTSAETLIGRFLKTGELDDLVEVDPAE